MTAPQWADKAHYAALDPRAARTHFHGGEGPPRGRPPARHGGGAPPRGGGRSWRGQEGEGIGRKPPWESPLSAGNNEREGGEGGSAAATRLPSNPNPISTGGRDKLDGRPGGQKFPLPLYLSPPSQTDRGDDEARALPHQRPLRKVLWGFIVGWQAAAAGVTTRRGAGGPTQGSCAVGASHLLRCPPSSAPLRPPVVPRAVVGCGPRLLFPSVPYPHLGLATPRFSAPLCNVGPRGGHIYFSSLCSPLSSCPSPHQPPTCVPGGLHKGPCLHWVYQPSQIVGANQTPPGHCRIGRLRCRDRRGYRPSAPGKGGLTLSPYRSVGGPVGGRPPSVPRPPPGRG